MKRVVITGLGAVSPVGLDTESFWNGLKSGKCGVGPITAFDATGYPCRVAAQIDDFNPENYFDRRTIQRTARFTQFALAAGEQAVKSAGFTEPFDSPQRAGVVLGSGIGGLEVDSDAHRKLFEKGPSRVPAMTIPKMIVNEAAGNLAIRFGLHGPAHTLATACASGTDAIGQAFDMIRLGRADFMFAGGAEATIIEFGIAAFCSVKALSTSFNDTPEKASRPFDADRDGFVMGEGAGIVVLESLEHAQKRGASILAELVGYGATCDAYHLTAPNPEGIGASAAIQMALADAGLTTAEIDYINAHGTSTPTNDPVETAAIKSAFGDDAYRLKVSSIKGAIGHCLGAAGGLEAVAAVLAIRDRFFPPTLNLDRPDPACDLDYVPKFGQTGEIRAALSLSLGFGGHNSVIAIQRFEA